MKKFLFVVFMTFVSASIFAQIQRTAVFDFSQPLSLNPSITPPEGNSSEVHVTNKTFSNGDITIDFELGNQGLGTSIFNFTNIWTNVTTYYLKISQQAFMKIHAPKDGRIDQVSFSEGSTVGDLRVTDENLGLQKDGYKTWINSQGQDVHDLIYKNSFSTAQLKQITVQYTVPSTILTATSDLAENSVLEYFENLHLSFDRNMSIKDASNILLSDGTNSQKLSATIQDNIVTLSAANKIVKDGTYTLTIPAKSFVDKDGYENKEMKISFVIKVPFNPISFAPAQGTIEKLPLTVTADFGSLVGYVDESANLRLLKDGVPYLAVKAVKSSDNNKVDFKIQNITEPISTRGTYTLVVPANVVCNGMKGDSELERYNKAFECEFIVGGSQAYQKAKTLLENKSVGYPKESSAAYVTLKNVMMEDNPSDEEIKQGIESYLNETDVILPSNKKWYKIASINKDGKKLYLAVKEQNVSLVKDMSDGSAFEATTDNDTFILSDADGFMLNMNGVTDNTSNSANKLTLAKLNGSNVQMESSSTYEAEKALGCITLKGIYESLTGNKSEVYALVNHETPLYHTEADVTVPYWQSILTSAFVFTEVDKPMEAIKTVETAYKLAPTIVESNNEPLTLSFNEVSDVTVANDAHAYIADLSGNNKKSVTFVPVEGKDNQFTIDLTGLAKAEYQLVIPEGTFIYEKDSKEVKTQAINANFTIGKNGSADDAQLNYDYSNYQLFPATEKPIKDVALNEVLIKDLGYFNGLVANPDREVRIAVYDNNKTIRSGHLESYVDPNDPQTTTLKLVFETPIVEGELKAGSYAIVLLQGTFGDNNFGKFLNDKTSIDANNCHANPRMTIPFDVDNDKATGIKEITSDSNKQTVIYDLMGRRVQNMNRPGIYIVNGKKAIKK